MKTVTIFLTALLSIHGIAWCQEKQPDPTEMELANDLNRMQYLFILANNGLNGAMDFEPVATQLESFQKLQDEKAIIDQELRQLPKELGARLEKLAGIKIMLKNLETELTETILLPHQVELLRQSEFEHLVTRYSGNFATVVENYYKEEFDLHPTQQEKLDELRKEQSKAIRIANEDYNKKLRQIELDSRKKMAVIFTPKQVEIIERLSGKPLIPKSQSPKNDQADEEQK
jgi:hypothetical protein